ncbi:MAG: hypothetical protein WC209_17395 [Ignavibacteriaceae bacterium]|jgi:hypothetical protein
MKRIILLLIVCSTVLFAQNEQKIVGTVTYISSQNFYARFENTNSISVGDTIYLSETGTQVGIIKYLSSQSAACSYLSTTGIDINAQVYILLDKKDVDNQTTNRNTDVNDPSLWNDLNSVKTMNAAAENNFDLSGRVSVRSFTNYTTTTTHAQNQYWRYGLSLRSNQVYVKNLEFQSSATYGYRSDNWKNSGSVWNNLKVYDFFFSYKPAESFNIQAGRIRNQNLYSLSAFDGVLFDYSFSKFTIGTFVGSHPDWQNMGVNIKLMQYGAFLSREDSLGKLQMSNNLSFANQTNSGKTDRRFLYFLHRTRLTNFSFALSSEFDLYEVAMHSAKSVFKPTSIYVSTVYRFDKKLSFDLSYDARKIIYYFESFKSTIDSILDSRMRQGVRLGAYYQWSRTLSVGLNGGFAKQNDDVHPSFNGGTSVSFSELTKLNFIVIADFTYLQSNYLNGFSYGVKVNKNFLTNYLNAGVGFRRVDYLFARNTSDGIGQNIVDADLRWMMFKSLYFNIVYEFVSEKRITSNRIFVGISQSF